MAALRRELKAFLWPGLLVGVAIVNVALTGMVSDFNVLQIISGVLSLGYAIMLLLGVASGYVATRTEHGEKLGWVKALLRGGGAGLVTGAMVAVALVPIRSFNLRAVLVNATPDLITLLTFGRGFGVGIVLLVVGGAVLGVLGAFFRLASPRVRSLVVAGMASVVTFGVLQDLFVTVLSNLGTPEPVVAFLFRGKGLSPLGAVVVFVVFAGLNVLWPVAGRRLSQTSEGRNQQQQATVRFVTTIATLIITLGLLGVLPRILGIYWTEVVDNWGLYILMGLGLNIVVGLAGLLDLGYVAFFAFGAYTVGLLTSPRVSLGAEWSFWLAWPVGFAVAALAGVVLGIPVLRMRGDYLAIVTLGFGEIIRILALSDLLKPFIGGAQGILEIPKPVWLSGVELITSQQIYYVILAGCLLAVFVSWRFNDSRIGRAWMAIREDEDVAEAMGINLVKYKLLAFASGAFFSGMSGGIFASKLSSIYPHSFSIFISINVLCLIIIGGMGSIPGVIVGAFIFVFLPEVLRFAAEYRLLMYGLTLVVMMLVKPEGFWPAAQRKRELRMEEEVGEAV